MNILNKITKKTFSALFTAGMFLLTAAAPVQADAPVSLKVGVVNFKQCVEKSKMGKQEQSSFEALKNQAEQVLQNKEKELNAIALKLEDSDYLDSLSNEGEAELKHRFRALNQEMQQQQQQLYQTLSQANFKIVQKLTDEVAKAAKSVAAKENFQLVINEDACFHYAQALDLTDPVIKALDDLFENQAK